MKRLNKLIISLSLVFVGLCLGINFVNPTKVFAEADFAPGDYFIIQKEYNTDIEGGEQINIDNFLPREGASNIEDGSAVFVKDANEQIRVILGETIDGVSVFEKISNLTYKITINDMVFDNQASAAMEMYGMSLRLSQNNRSFDLVINPQIAQINNGFIYGKYTFEFSYYYLNSELTPVLTSHTASIYVFRYGDYFNNQLIYNGTNAFASGENFFSNYSIDSSAGSEMDTLMYLYYDYKFYNLSIVRSHQGLATTTNLKYVNGTLTISSLNEINVATNVHNVTIKTNQDNTKAIIVFKDLGTYHLTYELVNPFGQGEVVTKFYEERPILAQNAYVFGYQMFYTGQNGLEEFKKTNNDKPWIIDAIEYSADVTTLCNSDSDEENINTLYNISINDIAKTNQAPVYPQTNALIDVDASKYYYFSTAEDFQNKQPTTIVDKYTGTPVSKEGIYIFALSYKYSQFSGNSLLKQYFMFRITNDAPVVNVYAVDDQTLPATEIAINNNEYTYLDVFVSKSALGTFDSKSTLTVYIDSAFNGQYSNGVVVAEDSASRFTQTGKYKVELTYGNTSQKGFTSYFTIDKDEISEIEFKKLDKEIGSNYRVGQVLSDPYLTNNAISLSWKEKRSGAIVTAEYKFFPSQYSAGNAASLTSSELKTLYNSQQLKYSIPSTHVISYLGGELPVSEYSNTYGKTTLTQSQVLSAGGLYIFHIYDNTGAEGLYFSVFIDNTPNSIISASEDVYSLTTSQNVSTKDTTIYFGKTKLIKLDLNLNATWDSWLINYLNDQNSTTYKNQKYLTVGINPTVYYSKDSSIQPEYILNQSNHYGYSILAENNGVANESQYIFYTISESTNTTSIYNKNSFEYYKQNYSNTHTVTFSTDNSRMTIFYAEEGGTKTLEQLPIIKSATSKTSYYQPTAQDTLKNAGEILRISYCISPSDTLEVESIILKYYAFDQDEENLTYKFLNSPSANITIYEKGAFNWGSEVAGQLNTFLYEINVETYNGSNTRTKSGKYEIIRTYTSESLLNSNDPIERKLVFIVDRNSIISDPVVDSEGNSLYFAGSGIQLQIINKYGLNYYAKDTLHFYDIYYATKLSKESLVPVLTTNFLPVTVYVPSYKYGYVLNEGGYPVFNPEMSIVSYPTKDSRDYFKNYKLTAIVERYSTASLSTKTDTYVYDTVLNSNFLTTSSSGNSIISYNQQGFYKTTITSNAGDVFTFVFEIKYSTPEFDLLDIENTPMVSDQNGIYYTNKKTVRISWEDSPSAYLARINQNAIQYTINGVTGIIDPNKTPIQKNGENKYYVDLDIESLGAYVDGTDVYLTLQFNGKQEDYNNNEYFSKTVCLKVDLKAPIYNVGNLVEKTGLSFYDLRYYKEGYKFNTSVNNGLFRYFSFTVEKSKFETDILTPNGTNYDYYKMYYRVFVKDGLNTKYLAGGNNETDITLTDLTGQTNGTIWGDSYTNFTDLLKLYKDVYLELIEEDYAGNRSVYTIYLCDIASVQAEEVLSYSYLTEASADAGDTKRGITFEQLSSEVSLYSKYSFNLESLELIKNKSLGDLTWQLVSVNGKMYVKSPYSNGKYYSYNEYNVNKENKTYTLKELTTLYSSASSQNIEIYLVPNLNKIKLSVYVLNKTLEIYTLSQITDSNLYEGILIKIPEARVNENNLLYATSLKIKATFGGTFVSTYEIIDEKYFKEAQTEIPSLSSIKISYVIYRNAKYLQVEMLGNININDYFVYTITDNFGEKYTKVHIFGQTEIHEPISGDGNIVQSYDTNGAIVYYSSENVRYRYDTTIYEKVHITVGKSGSVVSGTTYTLSKTDSGYNVVKFGTTTPVSKLEYDQYFEVTVLNSVLLIEMKQIPYNFTNGEYGGSRTFNIELVPKQDFSIEKQTVRFEIYNAIPNTLNLISKSGGVDVTSILGGGMAYAGEVIINFVYSSLKFDYQVLIMNPNGDVMALTDQMEINKDGTYKIIVNYLGSIAGCSKTFEFTLAKSDEFVYSVAKKMADGTFKNILATGAGYTYTENGVSKTISTHYILTGQYQIILNSNLYLVAEIEKGPIDTYTYIYKISNLGSIQANNGLITEYYTTKIAISVMPESGDILKRLVRYGGNAKEQTDNLLELSSPSTTPYVTTKDEYDAGIRIAWSKYNLIPENLITVEVYYGDINGMKYNAKIEEVNALNSITLKTSGTYYIKFIDKAGNVESFGAYSDNQYFTIKYLSSVIFEVQETTPINYAIYDTNVEVRIPDITLAYYDVNAKPIINVELNGVPYTGFTKKGQYRWTFEERGLYKVWFTAKIDEKNIYESATFFTILSSKESRESYTYQGYTKYYIEDILFNGESKKAELTNINNGEILTVNGVQYLKSLALHSSDIKTGNGYWTFVINTNNEFDQVFKFTVWINKAIAPIELSIPNGASTTDTIIVSFNTQNLLTATGDCVLKITGYENLIITQENLDNGELKSVYEISLTDNRNYYIEITSLSGQLLYSSYVIKAEPLNAVSIIIIVVFVLVAIVGTVLFVLLRRKMKIR